GWSARRVQWPRPFLVSGRPPTATLCPYTTLFRSACTADRMPAPVCPVCVLGKGSLFRYAGIDVFASRLLEVCQYPCACRCHWLRSEEHTSELQSRENLVCRLLLEKKNDSAVLADP